ncbi:MAG: ASKHA domain-containing protein [Chloroflexota bacterium]
MTNQSSNGEAESQKQSVTVSFLPLGSEVQVPVGTLVADAAKQAGIELSEPCGGQGRCGRCAVKVESGSVRRRSTVRLSDSDIQQGFALACTTVIESDCVVDVPPQRVVQRKLTTDKTAPPPRLHFPYVPSVDQTLHTFYLEIDSPSMADQTDDWSRLRRALIPELRKHGCESPGVSLAMLRRLGTLLRQADWRVTVVVEMGTWDRPECPAMVVNVRPGTSTDQLWGVAIDIGTTTVTVMLVDLLTGEVRAQAADYNEQITRGEDVISRIIYASKGKGVHITSNQAEMQSLVMGTINRLIEDVSDRVGISSLDIDKATIVGNSTMMHLLLNMEPSSIRLEPFITTVNQPPIVPAEDLGLAINPAATVDCLPGVASYVGSDITAGVVSSRLHELSDLTLFLDVGTNGEIVLGTADWLITCAASAGPAFEGAGVLFGMRATEGAMDEVWVNEDTYESSYRVIGNVPPKGMCGSALINLLAEMFITGVMDKAGNINLDLETNRVRDGEFGPEYVLAWEEETEEGVGDIVITAVDIDNLLRAKAAIYAGFDVLARAVGVDLADVEQILIGGNFGKYINVEKAIQIGLLPDLAWDRFTFLGNSAVHGAYLALLSRQIRSRVTSIAEMMTYLELSSDNTFYDVFSAALFLPHTDRDRFPSVKAVLEERNL